MEDDSSYNDTKQSESWRLQQKNDYFARELIPAMAFIGVLMFLGVVGNILVCVVYGFRLPMRTQHFLILTLAVFDLLTCFIAMPTEIASMRYLLMFESEFACRILKFTAVFNAMGSALVLVIIAVDRYMKICRPLGQQMSLRHTKMGVVAVLLVTCVFSIPTPLLAGKRVFNITYDNLTLSTYACAADGSDVPEKNYYSVYSTILFVPIISVAIVLSVLYVCIWKSIRAHNRRFTRTADLPASSSASLEAEKSRKTTVPVRTHKTTVIALLVTLVFFLSCVPFFVIIIATDFEHELRGDKPVLYHIFLRFPLFNAVANPFIYSALNPAFRAECFKLFMCIPFCCKRSRERLTDNQREDDSDCESENKREGNNENDFQMTPTSSSS